jgi:hypothetical protein
VWARRNRGVEQILNCKITTHKKLLLVKQVLLIFSRRNRVEVKINRKVMGDKRNLYQRVHKRLLLCVFCLFVLFSR